MGVERMNHQVQNLAGFRLELESFHVCCHGMSVARVSGRFKLGGLNPLLRPPRFFGPSTKLMELRQESFVLFAACQRSKSAPRMKNFRPIWTIRMRSSLMIMQKSTTEKPASSAALGISRNVFFR